MCVCRKRVCFIHLKSPFDVVVFQKVAASQTLTAGIILLCGYLYFSMFLPEGEARLSQLGLTCRVFTVSMYLSPLSSLVRSGRRFDSNPPNGRRELISIYQKKSPSNSVQKSDSVPYHQI